MLQREPYLGSFERVMYKLDDPALHAVLNMCAEVTRGANSFSEKNEELFMALVVDVAFTHGLCAAVRTAATHIEDLQTTEYHMAEAGQTDSEAFASLNAAVSAALDRFHTAFARLPAMRRGITARIASNFAKLATSMDPVPYPWAERCARFISVIPDPDWE